MNPKNTNFFQNELREVCGRFLIIVNIAVANAMTEK